MIKMMTQGGLQHTFINLNKRNKMHHNGQDGPDLKSPLYGPRGNDPPGKGGF